MATYSCLWRRVVRSSTADFVVVLCIAQADRPMQPQPDCPYCILKRADLRYAQDPLLAEEAGSRQKRCRARFSWFWVSPYPCSIGIRKLAVLGFLANAGQICLSSGSSLMDLARGWKPRSRGWTY